MASAAAAIAEALKVDVVGQSWPVTVSANREFLAPIRLADLSTTNRVSIFPYTLTVENVSRGAIGRDYGVGLVLRAQASPADTAGVDALVETIEDMADRYLKTVVGGATPTGVSMILGDELYDVDRLAQDLLFQGGILITYTTRT